MLIQCSLLDYLSSSLYLCISLHLPVTWDCLFNQSFFHFPFPILVKQISTFIILWEGKSKKMRREKRKVNLIQWFIKRNDEKDETLKNLLSKFTFTITSRKADKERRAEKEDKKWTEMKKEDDTRSEDEEKRVETKATMTIWVERESEREKTEKSIDDVILTEVAGYL